MKTFLLAGLIGLLGCSSWAHAQPMLGRPIPLDASRPASDIPTREEVARMITEGGCSPAEITAAKIKIEEAHISSSRAAVRYLATVDCHFYPEAEIGLIAALRTDHVEAVRQEAALSIGNCKRATARMLDALQVTAQGSDSDGNPAESSLLVREAARVALARCIARAAGNPVPEPPAPSSESTTIQSTALIFPSYSPNLPPAAPRERELARTVGTRPAPAASQHRPLVEFLKSLVCIRESSQSSGRGPGSLGAYESPASRHSIFPLFR